MTMTEALRDENFQEFMAGLYSEEEAWDLLLDQLETNRPTRQWESFVSGLYAPEDLLAIEKSGMFAELDNDEDLYA